MIYVYILQSRQDRYQVYYGQTHNLKVRLQQHNSGQNLSTKPYTPWKVIYFEAYTSRSLALAREKQLKHYGQARTALKKRLGLTPIKVFKDQWDRAY